jgi:hypothetical protein
MINTRTADIRIRNRRSVAIGKGLIHFKNVLCSLDILNGPATYYTVSPPPNLPYNFKKPLSPTELGLLI